MSLIIIDAIIIILQTKANKKYQISIIIIQTSALLNTAQLVHYDNIEQAAKELQHLIDLQSNLNLVFMMSRSQEQLFKKAQEQIEISHEIEDKIKQSIKLINDQGRYQVFVVILMSLCNFLGMYQLCSPSFFFMNPNFECAGQAVTEDQACLQLDRCQLTNDYTVTAQNHLYCDRKDVRSLIQSMFGVGSMLGVLFVSFISDNQGRKFSLVIALCCQIMSTLLVLIGSYWDIIPLFVVAMVLAGFGANSLLPVSYVYMNKILSKFWAGRSVLLANGAGNLAELTLIFFISYSNWKVCALYAVVAPTILVVLTIVTKIAEDPIILYSLNRIEQCKQSLAHIARFNAKQDELPQVYAIIDDLRTRGITFGTKKKTCSESMGYLKLLLKKTIVVAILCIGIHEFGANLVYFSLFFSISEIGYSYGVSLFIFGVAQFMGIFPLMFCSNKLPRRASLAVMVLMIIGVCMVFLLDLDSITETILVGITRFILSNQYTMYIFLSVESFPQHIQSTAYGIIEFLGQACKPIAPLEVQFSKQLGVDPIVALGLLAFVLMLIPLLFVKETLKSNKDKQESQQVKESLLSQ